MDPTSGATALERLRELSTDELGELLFELGEERHARKVARSIHEALAAGRLHTTTDLATAVLAAIPAREQRQSKIHPATRTFQALRIFVNQELAELATGLAAAEAVLAPGGRLVAVAFHSLEDRIAKTFLAERSRRGGTSRHRPEIAQAAATFQVLTRRPVVPDEAEMSANPRARSAKLRAAERTGAAIADELPDDLLPRLPSLAEVMGHRR
jgi:16S rRNA (cytosine1402-N4)-methyltransferase